MRVGVYEGSLSPEILQNYWMDLPKVELKWSEKQKLLRSWKWRSIKSLLSIFNVFFIQTSPKFGQKSKQIQCKSLILLTLGLQVAKARQQFLAFFDIFGQVRYFGQFQNKLFNPETKFQISGSNWYKFHPNRTQHCLRRLKMSSLFFFVSYPMLPNFL